MRMWMTDNCRKNATKCMMFTPRFHAEQKTNYNTGIKCRTNERRALDEIRRKWKKENRETL